MNVKDFWQAVDNRPVPVFTTTKDLAVTTYVWTPGRTPESEPMKAIIPAGTELVRGGVGSFGTGYGMQPRNYRVLKGKNASRRWFRVNFSDMKFLGYF